MTDFESLSALGAVRDLMARYVFSIDAPGRFRLLRFVALLRACLLHILRMNCIQVESAEEILSARELFEEYAAWLEINLCFQDFERELAELPGAYKPPNGRLLLAFVNQQLAGCVALRDLGGHTCEMKRLYLKPEFHGKGLGRVLAEKIIQEARVIGYWRMRLDTLPGKMDKAIALYRSLGFREIPAYYSNPVRGATFMELTL